VPDIVDVNARDSLLFNDNAFERDAAIGLLDTLEKQRFARTNDDANDLFWALVRDMPDTVTGDEAKSILNHRFGEVITALPEAWGENLRQFSELLAEPDTEVELTEEYFQDLFLSNSLEEFNGFVTDLASGLKHVFTATSDVPAAMYFGEVDPSELTVGDADHIL